MLCAEKNVAIKDYKPEKNVYVAPSYSDDGSALEEKVQVEETKSENKEEYNPKIPIDVDALFKGDCHDTTEIEKLRIIQLRDYKDMLIALEEFTDEKE